MTFEVEYFYMQFWYADIYKNDLINKRRISNKKWLSMTFESILFLQKNVSLYHSQKIYQNYKVLL